MTNHNMLTFKELLNLEESELMSELFDNPYKVDYEGAKNLSSYNDRTQEHTYKFHDHENNPYHVIITHDNKTGEAELSFHDKDGRQSKTGSAGKHAARIFSSVADAMEQHKKKNPNISSFFFSSTKRGLDPEKRDTRGFLYKKFAASQGGYSEEGRYATNHYIPVTEQSFSDLVASSSRFSKDMKSFVKNNKSTNDIQAREPAEPLPKFKSSEKKLEPKVDFTGSRYDLGNGQIVDPSTVTNNKINPRREINLRKDYRSPPGGYPENIKDRLAAADARPGEPPMPGSGPYRFKRADPLKTSPSVPVEKPAEPPPKPKLRPTQVTDTPPKPKLRPTAAQEPVQKKQSFQSAFAAAKKAGLKKFSWNNMTYNTRTK